MGSVVISGATSGAITLAVPAEAGTHTVTIPSGTGQLLNSGDLSSAGDTAAGNAAAVGYTAAEGLILTGQGSTSDVTIKNDADATVLSIPTGSGNVGIGTTAATTYANSMGNTAVVGTGNNWAVIQGRTDGPSGATNGVNYGGSYASNPINGARMFLGAAGGAGQRGLITFHTKVLDDNTSQPLERMRVDSSGNLLVAGTSFNANGSVCIGPIGTSVNGCTAVSASASATNIWRFYNSNGNIGTISISGSTTSYATSSDYRLKENVVYDWDATTRLKQLKPARFNFIGDADKTVDGFLAHEAQAIVPEAITGTKDEMRPEVLYVEGDELPDGKSVGDVKEASAPDYQGIDQSKLVPLLVKTIQELEARITALEA